MALGVRDIEARGSLGTRNQCLAFQGSRAVPTAIWGHTAKPKQLTMEARLVKPRKVTTAGVRSAVMKMAQRNGSSTAAMGHGAWRMLRSQVQPSHMYNLNNNATK